MRTITFIILHCSATRAGQCYGFERCRKDHIRRGMQDIGYHYYVTPNEWLKQCPCFDALLDYEDLQPEGLF